MHNVNCVLKEYIYIYIYCFNQRTVLINGSIINEKWMMKQTMMDDETNYDKMITLYW